MSDGASGNGDEPINYQSIVGTNRPPRRRNCVERNIELANQTPISRGIFECPGCGRAVHEQHVGSTVLIYDYDPNLAAPRRLHDCGASPLAPTLVAAPNQAEWQAETPAPKPEWDGLEPGDKGYTAPKPRRTLPRGVLPV